MSDDLTSFNKQKANLWDQVKWNQFGKVLIWDQPDPRFIQDQIKFTNSYQCYPGDITYSIYTRTDWPEEITNLLNNDYFPIFV